MLAVFFSHNMAAGGAEPPFRSVGISASLFAEAFAARDTHQQTADTVTSEQICSVIQTESEEKLRSMEPDEASSYNIFPDSPFEVYPILEFPFGLIACGVYKGHEEYEYWFFNKADYKFVAMTDSPLCNYVSDSGYMATVRHHNHDSLTDISVYRLKDGGIKLVHKFADMEISSIEQACWGADALYISGEYVTDGDDPDFIPTYLKLTLPQ